MPYDSQQHRRRSIRLRHWDYAESGAYFITICTSDRAMLFGAVRNDRMVLNQIGDIVAEEWRRSAEIRSELQLDEFVVMPNHLHAIVLIARNGGRSEPVGPRPFSGTEKCSLSAFVQGFKASTTKRIGPPWKTNRSPLWQRNFYERVLRNDRELDKAREYIRDNLRKWAEDKNNPNTVGANGIRPPAPVLGSSPVLQEQSPSGRTPFAPT